ncbi:protein ARK2N isoform X1 [Paroedura picta]|uniref:protein ARK2N isoform X1 n=1 Tax=Paroedura picta TaxID=143630 RepID=UPI004057600C
MKMEAADKVEELIGPEAPPKLLEKPEAALGEDGPLELEMHAQKESGAAAEDSTVLASMPCLLMELRRDSSESQLASTESDKPTAGRIYESDSSNHCMLSPSSSGHLADSDTLSSAEENEPSQAGGAVEGEAAAVPGSTIGRKSRRSRSESETSTMAAKKNRQSSDKQNGRVAKVKGHRSQKHKERIRLLRQKREAAARKKYNLLQDSSTSDSDLTCDSSTSSSDDDEEVSGSSKTITAEIPEHTATPCPTPPCIHTSRCFGRSHEKTLEADFSRAGGSGGATREIPGLLDRGTVWDRNCIGSVLEEAMNCFAEMQRQTEEKFRTWIEKLTRLDTDEESKQQLEPREAKVPLAGQRISPTTRPGVFMQVPDSQVLSPQSFNSYVSCQNADPALEFPATLNNNFPAVFPENGNIAEANLNQSQS